MGSSAPQCFTFLNAETSVEQGKTEWLHNIFELIVLGVVQLETPYT